MNLFAIITSVFYIAGIIAAIEAVTTTRTAQGAIAWSLSLITFPFIALPAYLVLGRNKFEGMSKAYAERQDEIDSVRESIRNHLQPWRVGAEEEPGWFRAVSRLAGNGLTRDNRVELLINGEATFDSILEGIAGACRYIQFHFYIIRDDGLGRRLQQALIERARQGVRVFVLYDEIGSAGLSTGYIQALRDAGAEVTAFKTTQGSRNRFQLNFRNHRKIVVVDGRAAWVGGHNVGDEYLGLDPAFSPWRDTHVRLEGPCVQQLQAVALADWYWASRDIPDLDWAPSSGASGSGGKGQNALILPSGPVGPFETASLYFAAALNAARERIWLTAPYFVPDDAVMKSLQLAALRGVDVRIITNKNSDSLATKLAAFHFIGQLRGIGIRFYAYEPGMLHGKSLLIDDSISVIGTHNFDNRSFHLNFEVAALIQDQPFAREVEAMFNADFEHAEPIDPESIDERPFHWRLGVAIARLAAPIL